MKTMITMLLMCLMAYAAQAQNYIVNGTMDADTNYDNLADGWYVDNQTDAMLDNGWQYVSSMNTCEFGQVVNIANPAGRTFRLIFDIESNDLTQCRIWIDQVNGNGFICSSPNPQPVGVAHYDLTFFYFQPTLSAVEFRTVHPGNWMRVDNVSFTEVFPVGIQERETSAQSDPLYYDMLGRKLQEAPVRGSYVKVVDGKGKVYVK